ncbi:phosphate acetyltransferase [Nocardioides dongxiaopingii]|uniref:phosphate acetyltransferase n=1 Tax=Nocardioides TaxID=1839 RepID=UPI0010C766B1|nr:MULTISPECIES: phosphate acetyltransferase [Nocardioides]QCW50444.1 phosphate acetyltransferase [Nocardioides sp. S-1144]
MSSRMMIASPEGHAGKSIVALGLVDALSRRVGRVGVFRPVSRSSVARDSVLELLLRHDAVDLDYDEAVGTTYEAVHEDADAALGTIVTRFHALEDRFDAIVVVGTDYTDVGSPAELGFNARVAANLGAPVVLVLGGRDPETGAVRTAGDLHQLADVTLPELRTAHAHLAAVVVNRSDVPATEITGLADVPVWAIPEDPILSAPTVHQLFEATDAELVGGDPALLERESLGTVVAGMSMDHVLDRLIDGGIVVVPGDRSDVVVATLLAQRSEGFPTVAGIILNGGFDLAPPVQRLIDGLDVAMPIGRSPHGTYETARRVAGTRGMLSTGTQRKRDTALAVFEKHVEVDRLLDVLQLQHSDVVTPLMFEQGLIERARADVRHIVLPEGDDDRVLRAASTILQRGVARLTVLGDETAVRGRAAQLGLDLTDATVVATTDETLRHRYAEAYRAARAHKGTTFEEAWERVTDVSYFGTMMVHLGDADGMVSGAAHTTAHTIRPSFEVVKTKPGVSVVSSVFLMALADRVLVYGDCAVVPEPTATELADIAISSARTALDFDIEPRVAMLSYSTGESGAGADVDKVREATRLVRERAPELAVEGPIQYDAAADPTVAAAKMPDSEVAGRATVFVFPDLNTGNNTYKAVQRSAGALAIGPVLQGLNKPVNDLSRGALVADIVNTVAITAIQAQAQAPAQSRAQTPGTPA